MWNWRRRKAALSSSESSNDFDGWASSAFSDLLEIELMLEVYQGYIGNYLQEEEQYLFLKVNLNAKFQQKLMSTENA